MSEKDILFEFAKHIQDIDDKKYDSKFISIYNELVKHYRITGALKAGSYGKGTIVDLKGDLDIIFAIDNPDIIDIDDFRKDLAVKLKQSFPCDHVERKKRSVFIKFRNNLSVDVVYLSKEEFEKEKGQIKHVQNINDQLRKTIVLIKYWKIDKKMNEIESYEIEWSTIYSSKTEIKERIIDSLTQLGLNQTACESAYQFIYTKALHHWQMYFDD